MVDYMSYFKTIWGLISDTVARAVRIDSSTHAMESIDYAHHEVHGGSHFTFTARDADLDTAQTMEYLIVTPDTTKWAHLILTVDAQLETLFQFFEDATHTVLAAQNVYNNNRNSATANTITVNTHNADGADGTEIYGSLFGIDTGGGVNRIAGGGADRGDQEWILKQNAKYLVMITSNTDDNIVSLKLSWYEHTDKD